jgi:hypothetical protein
MNTLVVKKPALELEVCTNAPQTGFAAFLGRVLRSPVFAFLFVLTLFLMGHSSAFALDPEPVDYGATLTANLTTINTIWAAVAVIIIGVALVKVGTKFFKKAG